MTAQATTSSPGSSSFPIWQRQESVVLQLCPPLQFGPLTYQPIECVFTSSNQSALWSCLLHVTSQLGEGCSMTFVRFVFLILWKTCVWSSFGAWKFCGINILHWFVCIEAHANADCHSDDQVNKYHFHMAVKLDERSMVTSKQVLERKIRHTSAFQWSP